MYSHVETHANELQSAFFAHRSQYTKVRHGPTYNPTVIPDWYRDYTDDKNKKREARRAKMDKDWEELAREKGLRI